MEQIFTKAYAKKAGTPRCFKDYIDRKLGKTSFIDDLSLRSREALQSSEGEHSSGESENEF